MVEVERAALILAQALFGVWQLVVARWVDDRGEGEVVRTYTMVLLTIAAWSFVNLGVTLAPTYGTKVWVYSLSGVAAWAVGPLWFTFAVYYTGRKHWITRPLVAALGGFYAVAAGLQVTNPFHGLLYEYRPAPDTYAGITVTGKPINGALVAGVYLTVVVGFVLLFVLFLRSRRVTRRQSAALIAGPALPLCVNALENAGLFAGMVDTPTIVSLGLSTAVVAFAVFRYRMFNVEPLARDTVLSEVEDAILTVDRQLRVVDYNEAADLFPDDEGPVGRGLHRLRPELLRSADPPVDADDFVEEVTLDDRVYDVTVSPVSVNDSVRAFTLILGDVTEQVEYANRLERRTEQLDEFASTVSHDLRNPLSVVEAEVRLAKQTGDVDRLEETEEVVDRMYRIIDDALALARGGEDVQAREQVSLSRLAKEAWRTSETRDATLEVDLEPRTTVEADPDRLRRALENLFRNAAEHAGPEVTVRVGATDGGFFVADDGPGIPPDQRDRTFQRGYTTADEGTGFGLAIVETIAQAHGWSVGVEESDEGGAKFVFRGVDGPDGERDESTGGPQVVGEESE